jgi:hypothetical protein
MVNESQAIGYNERAQERRRALEQDGVEESDTLKRTRQRREIISLEDAVVCDAKLL